MSNKDTIEVEINGVKTLVAKSMAAEAQSMYMLLHKFAFMPNSVNWDDVLNVMAKARGES